MPEPIESVYFNWLRAKVTDLDTPSYLYYDLMRLMYGMEFVWTHIGDRNRVEDGKELRQVFLNETGTQNERAWFEMPCSIFEVLVAFANRVSFETGTPVRDWFWTFMTNLQLIDFRTISDPDDEATVLRILEIFVWRMYDPNGYGGLFPLREPKNVDQRSVELWYQWCEYLEDQGLV